MTDRKWEVFAAYSVALEGDPHPRVAHYPAAMHTVTDEELPAVLAADAAAFASTGMWLVRLASSGTENEGGVVTDWRTRLETAVAQAMSRAPHRITGGKARSRASTSIGVFGLRR